MNTFNSTYNIDDVVLIDSYADHTCTGVIEGVAFEKNDDNDIIPMYKCSIGLDHDIIYAYEPDHSVFDDGEASYKILKKVGEL